MAKNVEDGIESNNRIPTIQHNKPISKGGKHELGNISVICKECNVTIRDEETGELNAAEVIEVWDQLSGKCPSSGCQLPATCHTQDRLGKDRLVEDRSEEDIEPPDEERPALPPPIPYETIKKIYNETCKSFSKCSVMSEARKKAIKARFTSGYTLDDFKRLFEMAEASSFLKGKNNRSWTASFDWLIKDANMAKVLDGNYNDTSRVYNQTGQDYGSPEDFYL
jgi:uncharacterized phage protein (TIGR02220 family)